MRNAEAKTEVFSTTTELVDFLNAHNVQKNDIVTVLDRDDELFLIYYA